MFKIMVTLGTTETLYGIKALDERRRLGLPDGSYIDGRTCGGTVSAEATEADARAYFNPNNSQREVTVSASMLVPGDVTLVDNRLVINFDMPESRIRALWFAGLVAELRAEIRALSDQLAEQDAKLERCHCDDDSDEE